MMTQSGAPPPLFTARLVPYRSLGPAGVRVVAGAAAVLALIPGTVFFFMGAWPVIGFVGLDVALLYWALSASLRGADRYEDIALWRDRLDVARVSERGERVTHRLNPFHVRLRAKRDHDGRITALSLVSRSESLPVGVFLEPEAKRRFASDFADALARAKR